MARFNVLLSGYSVIDEIVNRSGSTAAPIGHDYIVGNAYEIWTGAGKTGTKLVLNTDYTINNKNDYYSAPTQANTDIYTKVAIINGAYQNVNLYQTYTTIGDMLSIKNILEVCHPIGDVIFQGPNDADPATLYPGTTWDDVSWEEANMTRRTVGDLAGARFAGVPAHLAYTVTGGVPTVTITNGGSGYLSGGSGTITLTLTGTCTTQATRTATVSSGVITAINVVAAGAGYASGKVAVYDGVAGHGDLLQQHDHYLTLAEPAYSGTGYDVVLGGNYAGWNQKTTSSPWVNTAVSARIGAETSTAWTVVIKWRRAS